MRVEAVSTFYDVEADVQREVGDVFDATKERITSLNGTEYGKLVKTTKKAPAKEQ